LTSLKDDINTTSGEQLCDSNLANAWVETDSSALRNNALAVIDFTRSAGTSAPKLMAVVKANGYGHGSTIAALAFRTGGADAFAVTSLNEASELVAAGIDPNDTPILTFSPMVTEEQCQHSVFLGLHNTVCNVTQVELLNDAAAAAGKKVNVHLKVDTGMARLGLRPAEALGVAREINERRSLVLAGVYTHFATSFADDLSATRKQLKMFEEFCTELNNLAITGFLRHCANSAAILRLPESKLDMVRIGTLLYGQYPTKKAAMVPGLLGNTMSLRARVIFVKELPAGTPVGYGAEYVTRRPTRIAILPVGFADGVGMLPGSLTKGWRGVNMLAAQFLRPRAATVKFGDFDAKVLGRIAMQMMAVDVTDSPEQIGEGEIATVPARRLAVSSSLTRIPRKSEARS
jgi:alanine racemase